MKKGIRKKIEWNLYTFDKHFLEIRKLDKETRAFTDFLGDWFRDNGLKVVVINGNVTCETTIKTNKCAVALWHKYILKKPEEDEGQEFKEAFIGLEDYRHNLCIGLSDLAINCAYNKLIYP